jgi:hypothetical protein
MSTDQESYDLSGDVGKFPLTELFQFLDAGRHTGRLTVSGPEDAQGWCNLVSGGLAEASMTHLADIDAMIAMMGWKEGRFYFSHDEGSSPVRICSLPALLMECARLEDELERHMAEFPGIEAKLTPRDSMETPGDPLECGADAVFACISLQPGIRVPELEQMLALAPIKVRLAVAWLASAGKLRTRVSSRMRAIGAELDPNDWYGRMLRFHPHGVRVLVVSSPSASPHELVATLTRLSNELNAGPVSASVAGDGPSLARIRPPAGGLVSFTFLPMRRNHQYLFQSFARTADLVLMTSLGPASEQTEWAAASPEHVTRLQMESEDTDECLVSALRAYASSLLPP